MPGLTPRSEDEGKNFPICMATMVPGQLLAEAEMGGSGGQTLETRLTLTSTCPASALALTLWTNHTLLEVGVRLIAHVLPVPGIEPSTEWAIKE